MQAPAATGCTNNTPEWGSSLGTVSFASSKTWEISGNGITQVWSDAVQAVGCNKTTFVGGSLDNYYADCRSNPDYPGDLFSWCAVTRFASILCPTPWRVPTVNDFCNLDKAIFKTSTCNSRVSAYAASVYIDTWGGAYGGGYIYTPWDQGSRAIYWTQSDAGAVSGYSMFFLLDGTIAPQGSSSKYLGLALRCVR
jgi:uncharacterized protein (TIGR02145 family)